MILHTYTPNQCPNQVSTTSGFLRYSPDKVDLDIANTQYVLQLDSQDLHNIIYMDKR